MNQCFKFALLYLRSGISVIPIGQDKNGGWKRPLIKWERYQSELPTEIEADGWWNQWPEARVGIVTGRISGLIVVDIDPRHGGDTRGLDLPVTLISKTGGGGWHYFYRHPGNVTIPNATGHPREGIDIRGDGGYIVAPPSIHASGESYGWVVDFDPCFIATPPDWLVRNNRAQRDPSRWRDVTSGVSEGARNESAASLAGKLLRSFNPYSAWDLLWAWNIQYNKPPLPQDELLNTFTSIQKREYAKSSRHN